MRYDTVAQTDVSRKGEKISSQDLAHSRANTHAPHSHIISSVMKKNKIQLHFFFFLAFFKKTRELLVRVVKGLKQFHFHMSGPDREGGGANLAFQWIQSRKMSHNAFSPLCAASCLRIHQFLLLIRFG